METSALVIGANGDIARAIIKHLLESGIYAHIIAVSRAEHPAEFNAIEWHQSDYTEAAMGSLVETLTAAGRMIDRVFICHGVLHDDRVRPEKRLEELNAAAMLHVININAITPALWLKHLLPLLKKSESCRVAVFSARVGSISDNHLGGWYSYRASKSTLNMLLKSIAIEYARRAPSVKLLAFHPGTTATTLSRPFSKNVPEEKLFTPGFVASQLLHIMDELTVDGELSFLDWNNASIDW